MLSTPALVKEINSRQQEVDDITRQLLSSEPDSVSAEIGRIRQFVSGQLGNIRQLLTRLSHSAAIFRRWAGKFLLLSTLTGRKTVG